MPKSLHIRDLPDDVHGTLARRARATGTSLRAYVIDVLQTHSALPTVEEWLDGLDRLTPADNGVAGADAVAESRAEDDAELAAARRP